MNHNYSKYYNKFPPSRPCSCEVCLHFCHRPGWWLVSEAREAIAHGFAHKMMLEFAPDFTFGVLSPAFKGNEGNFALQTYAYNTCTFLESSRCTLFGKPFQPIECRYCHHDRMGCGRICHSHVERDWNTSKGKRLVNEWIKTCNLQPPCFFGK